MSWNYRIFKHEYPGLICDPIPQIMYELREVYYNDAGQVCGWTIEKPSVGPSESIDELIEEIEMHLRDAKKCRDDVLDFDMEPEGDWDY